MCPRPARPTKIELDPRVGGRFRIDVDDEGFELAITGKYLELERPRRLRFSWYCTTWASTTCWRPRTDRLDAMSSFLLVMWEGGGNVSLLSYGIVK